MSVNLVLHRAARGVIGLASLPLLAATAWATPLTCLGDCDLDRAVTVNELVRGVNIALGTIPVDDCPQFDRDASDTVSVDEIIVAVQNALNGCPRDTTPTPGGTTTAAPTATATA